VRLAAVRRGNVRLNSTKLHVADVQVNTTSVSNYKQWIFKSCDHLITNIHQGRRMQAVSGVANSGPHFFSFNFFFF